MIPDSDNVSREGFVYVLSNPAISGLIKIGRSERHPSYRVAELSRATGVPEPFVLEYWERVVDCAAAEALIHSRLSPVQVRGREFFRMSLPSAMRVVAEVCSNRRVQVTMPRFIEVRTGQCPTCGNPVTFQSEATQRTMCVLGHVVLRGDVAGVGRQAAPIDISPAPDGQCPSCRAELVWNSEVGVCGAEGCGYVINRSLSNLHAKPDLQILP